MIELLLLGGFDNTGTKRTIKRLIIRQMGALLFPTVLGWDRDFGFGNDLMRFLEPFDEQEESFTFSFFYLFIFELERSVGNTGRQTKNNWRNPLLCSNFWCFLVKGRRKKKRGCTLISSFQSQIDVG